MHTGIEKKIEKIILIYLESVVVRTEKGGYTQQDYFSLLISS
jgi:hypothetical protein